MAEPVLDGKLIAEIRIKSNPVQFFHSFSGKAHQLPNVCPDKFHGIHVHQGDWTTTGSIKLLTYSMDGKVEKLKERITTDEENKTVIADVIDGDIMNEFKSYRATLKVVSEGGANYAKWSIEYESQNENVPAPTRYLKWLIHVVKDVDASLLKA